MAWNLLLDEHREAYAAMTPAQKTCVRFAYAYGYHTKENAVSWEGQVDRQGGSFSEDEIENARRWT